MPSKKSIKKVVRKAKTEAAQVNKDIRKQITGRVVRHRINITQRVKRAKSEVRNSGKTIEPGGGFTVRGLSGSHVIQKAPHPKKSTKHKATHKTPKANRPLNTKAPSTSSTKK